MPSITAISSSKRDATRLIVKVDGKSAVTLSAERVAELNLAVDRQWTAELARRARQAAAYDKALRHAVRLLHRRPLSVAHLRQRLEHAEHGAEAIERVVGHLSRIGLLDDAALGRALIDELRGREPAGAELLRAKLAQRGLEEALVDQLIAESSRATDAVADARRLVERRARSLANVDAVTRQRRLWSLLARRGFDQDTIEAVLGDVVEMDAE